MRTEPAGLRATLALGSAFACVGSALFLLGFAARAVLFPPDCAGPLGPSDCALLREVAHELAFRQALVAAALLLLAVPLARRAASRRAPPHSF